MNESLVQQLARLGAPASTLVRLAYLKKDDGGTAPGSGTTNHALLTNRDAASQHPASSIGADDGKSVQVHIDGLTAVVSGTYAEIKSLRDSSQLIPGNLYRITDYETIYVQPVSNEVRSDSSALFDIVLLATDKNRFAPEAWAAHTVRTQPTGSIITSTTPLHQWRLLYDIDNNSSRHSWATSTGKGAVYRLIDHWANDLPYDFYNVKYRRYKITDTTTAAVSLVGHYLSSETTKTGFTVDSGDYVDLLTFDWSNAIRCNIFHPTVTSSNRRLLLNNTVAGPCRYNIFGGGFYNNTLANQCDSNQFGDNCYDNVLGEHFSFNRVETNFYKNTIVGRCRYNTFGNIFYENLFAGRCEHNFFNSLFYNNSFGADCNANIFNIGYNNKTFNNSQSYTRLFETGTIAYAPYLLSGYIEIDEFVQLSKTAEADLYNHLLTHCPDLVREISATHFGFNP